MAGWHYCAQAVGGSLADRLGRKMMMVLSMLGSSGEMILIPAGATFVAALAPPHLRGRYMGVQGLVISLGFGAGPLLGGALADRLGASQAWPTFLVLGLASTGAFLTLRRAQIERSVDTQTILEKQRKYLQKGG